MVESIFKLRPKVSAVLLTALCALSAYAQKTPDVGAHLPSQAAADAIRDFAATDGAFLAAGLINQTYDKDNLASLLLVPTDPIVILNLSGASLKLAFERSVSLYPQPNMSFLQISGFEVTFNKDASPDHRVVRVTVNGAPLDPGHNYTVAMPQSLGQGTLGYFKIWDRSKISKTLDKATVESVLKGKKYVETAPRWVVQG
jgi:2',3'-cyclic-nucleotide 2'-phosphodiesterase (5'-nucleotidase family)